MKDLRRVSVIANDPPYIKVNPDERVRCPICDKLIFIGVLGKGAKIEHRCRGCKNIIRFESL